MGYRPQMSKLLGAWLEQKDPPVAHAALSLEEEDLHEMPIAALLDDIASWAKQIDEKLGGARAPSAVAEHIAEHLFTTLGFKPNGEYLNDPRNAYLAHTLDRREGIPITLSMVYLGICNQLKMPAHGIGFPGHFLVQIGAGDSGVLVDPFGLGRALSGKDVLALLQQVLGADATLKPEHLAASSLRATLVRHHRNMKQSFIHRREYPAALRVSERLVWLVPEDTEERRDRGMLYEQLGCYMAAKHDYAWYLNHAPQAHDASFIRDRFVGVVQRVAHMH